MPKSLVSLRRFIYRIRLALSYFTPGLCKVFAWLFQSREDTNFTYDLTETSELYLLHFIADVTQAPLSEIRSYFAEIKSNEELKKHILETTAKSEFSSVSDDVVYFGKRVGWYSLVRILKPKVIIETGVDKGLGAVVLAEAVRKNREEGFEGTYYGTDINPKAGFLFTEKFQKYGRILYGDSIESLKNFSQLIDFFINDSDHSSEYEAQEYVTIQSKLSHKAVIIGDNAHVTDKLVKFAEATGRAFLFYQEKPKNHWYPGGGIGIAWKKNQE